MSLYKVMQQAVNFMCLAMCLAMCLLRFVQDRSDPTRLPLGQRAGACYMIILWSYYDLIWFVLARKITHLFLKRPHVEHSAQGSSPMMSHAKASSLFWAQRPMRQLVRTLQHESGSTDFWQLDSSVNKIDWSFWEIEDLPRLRFRFLFKSSQGWCWCYVRSSA